MVMVRLAQLYSVLFSILGFYGNRLNIDLDSLSFFSNMQLFHIERASDFIINSVLFHSSAQCIICVPLCNKNHNM